MRMIDGLAGAALLMLASPAAAATSLLDFDVALACNGGCVNGRQLLQSYGDTEDVDVSYRSRQGFGASTVQLNTMFWWNTGFGDLQGVAFGGNVAEVHLDLLTPGKTITLDSFDMARFTGPSVTELRIYDTDFNLLWSVADQFAPNGTSLSYAPGVSSTLGLILQHGPDAGNRAFDNIMFTISDTVDMPVVPEPGTWAMLIAGFGLVGTAARRRRLIQQAPA